MPSNSAMPGGSSSRIYSNGSVAVSVSEARSRLPEQRTGAERGPGDLLVVDADRRPRVRSGDADLRRRPRVRSGDDNCYYADTTAPSSSVFLPRAHRRRSCPAAGGGSYSSFAFDYDDAASSSRNSSFDHGREALRKHYPSATAAGGEMTTATEDVHPEKAAMKRRRRDKTATYGMVGAGVGTLILPVVGTVVGGFLSGYAANRSMKMQEKRIQRRWERDQFQRDASSSRAAMHAVFA